MTLISNFSTVPARAALMLILLLVALSASRAATVDPFVATVDVAARSEDQRNAGFRDALRQVLTKYSGSAALASTVTRNNPEALVQQFRYLERTNDSGIPITALEVRFQPDAIRALAREEGLGVWPAERGATLTWIAVEEGRERYLLGTDAADDAWISQLREHAERRALPLVEPLFDLEDQANVRIEAIAGGFIEDLREANARYQPTHVLYGRLTSGFGGWRARWILELGDGDVQTWSASGDAVSALLRDGIDGTAERLAARYAVGSNRDSVLELHVLGLRSSREFAFAQRYLKTRSVVQSLRISSVDPLGVRFQLTVDGGADSLRRILANDRQLAPQTTLDPLALTYRIDPSARLE